MQIDIIRGIILVFANNIVKIISIIMLILINSILGGCGKQINSSNSQLLDKANEKPQNEQSQQLGYVYSKDTSVMFIRWTEISKNILGQLQITTIDKDNNITSNTHSFEGVIDESNISIVFSGSVWIDSFSSITWTGTLGDKTLNLVYPSKDGILGTIQFRIGSVDEYNQAVLKLHNIKDIKECQATMAKYMGYIAKNAEIIEKNSIDIENIVKDIPVALSKENDSLNKTSDLLKQVLLKKHQGYSEIDIDYAAIDVDYEKNNVDYLRMDVLSIIDKADAKIKETSDNVKNFKDNYNIILDVQRKLMVLDPSSFTQGEYEQLLQVQQQCLTKYSEMGNAIINKHTPNIEAYRTQANQMLKQAEEYSAEAYSQ